ncbi:F-box/LRR-repeat protein At4g14096-like [Lotus japonicus]|uniref:F-box/LRR-repeat protein At4g14096-like n=1 Tax=Lotus japonicus TaxID=34305 RepID=UPI002584C0B8|nr:F-box/LRR-repeat protein At4g14096-like [Lotus japonicus]
MAGLISPPDVHKLQRNNVGDMKDMISILPDCILHLILSLLPTKEAIRTSILAKRWKYLWTFLSSFDFRSYLFRPSMKEDRKQKSACYLLDQVNRLLYHSNCVKKLCVTASGVSIDVDRVNSLISSAVKHKIEVLKLLVHVKPLFVLPNFCSASDTLNKLVLEPHCVLDVASGIYFPSLKTLKLSRVTFANEKSVQQLFSGCPVLQKLSLCNCNWCNIKQISITTPTLKILTIFSGLSVYMNSTVKIDAGNLLYFSYTGYSMVDFVLVNLASIVDARVDCFYPLFGHTIGTPVPKLLGGLGSIKSLKLSNDTLQACLTAS